MPFKTTCKAKPVTNLTSDHFTQWQPCRQLSPMLTQMWIIQDVRITSCLHGPEPATSCNPAHTSRCKTEHKVSRPFITQPHRNNSGLNSELECHRVQLSNNREVVQWRMEGWTHSSRTIIISLVDSNTSWSLTMRWCSIHCRTMSTSIKMSPRQDLPPRRFRRYLAAKCCPVAFSVHFLTIANFPLQREHAKNSIYNYNMAYNIYIYITCATCRSLEFSFHSCQRDTL